MNSKAPGDLVVNVQPETDVNLLPTSEIGSRYSELSVSWGVKGHHGYWGSPDFYTNYMSEVKEFCKLCLKLELPRNERLPVQHMHEHMRAK